MLSCDVLSRIITFIFQVTNCMSRGAFAVPRGGYRILFLVFISISIVPHLYPTEEGCRVTGNSWMRCSVGFCCCCFCRWALRDTCCLPKQCCPVKPCVDFNEDTISTQPWTCWPLLASCLLSDVPAILKTASSEAAVITSSRGATCRWELVSRVFFLPFVVVFFFFITRILWHTKPQQLSSDVSQLDLFTSQQRENMFAVRGFLLCV